MRIYLLIIIFSIYYAQNSIAQISNPNINTSYQTTNIFSEIDKKLSTEEIINLIISSYEKFFIDLNSYNYLNFREKIDLMKLTKII